MHTVRRIYFYAVAFISLEVVIWGSISLLRSLVSAPQIVISGDVLARALALVLVGAPIFVVHWSWVQRGAASDNDERTSPIRAIFLYGAMLATLIPAVQNLLALINRLLYLWGGLDVSEALLGGQQTWLDNLIAIAINGIMALYFFHVVRRTGSTLARVELFAGVRRLYRYLWLLYSLILTVFGIQQQLQFVLYTPMVTMIYLPNKAFFNGLSLILVGLPLWYFTWYTCQEATVHPEERHSYLRLGMLFLLTLGGMAVALSAAGILLALFLRWTLGELWTPSDFLAQVSSPLSLGVPMAVLWGYYGYWLRHDLRLFPEEARREEILRFYFYLRSLAGLIVAFIGATQLASFLLQLLIGDQIWGDVLRTNLANALAILTVGLPLWLRTWLPMQDQARAPGMTGGLARRSWIRKGYLYLVLFLSVIGGMFTAMSVVFRLLQAALGGQPLDLVAWLNSIKDALFFLIVLLYHLRCLRADGAETARALLERHAAFHALAFVRPSSPIEAALPAEVQKHAPGLRLTVADAQKHEPPSLPADLPPVRAVLLPSDLALSQSESVRSFLLAFDGPVIVVPIEHPRILWTGGANPIESAAIALRQLSEGQDVRPSSGASPWMIVIYLFAALFGFQVLLLVLSLGFALTNLD